MIRKQVLERDPEMEPLIDPSNVSGFSSPAKDYKEDRLHIMNMMVNDPTNTYYFKAANDEMSFYGINRGSIIVVDRSISVLENQIIVVYQDGQWLVRQYIIVNGKKCLINGKEDAFPVYVNTKTILFGTVTWCCNSYLSMPKYVRINRLQ